MSGGLKVLALKEEDVTKLLASSCHLGSTSEDYQMKQYIFRRKPDGECASGFLFRYPVLDFVLTCVKIQNSTG